jgi:hypothetical protein
MGPAVLNRRRAQSSRTDGREDATEKADQEQWCNGWPVDCRRKKGPQCKKGIKNKGLKGQLRLESKTFNKTVRHTVGLGVVKPAVGCPSGYGWVTEHCGGVGHLRSERRSYRQSRSRRRKSTGHSQKFHPTEEKTKEWYILTWHFCREPFGTSGRKESAEGAVWSVLTWELGHGEGRRGRSQMSYAQGFRKWCSLRGPSNGRVMQQ